ncbi:MAG: NADP-dependent oxidoreductase [Thermoplasmata archaeon]
MTEMMTAVAVDQFGAELSVQKLPVPAVGPGEIRVRLRAASVNPVDWNRVDGLGKDFVPYVFPMIPGIDGSGVVETCGPGTKRFRPGDEVFGFFWSFPWGRGTYAEYVVVSESQPILKIPSGLDNVDCAAIPVAGLTALTALDTFALLPGDSLLVHGASGGIGSFIIPLASSAGVRIVGTARPDAFDYVRALGAESVFDSRRPDLREALQKAQAEGFDGLLDLVSRSAEDFALVESAVRPGGFSQTPRGKMDPKLNLDRGMRRTNLEIEPTDDRLSRLATAVLKKRLRIPVTARNPLDHAPEAVRRHRQGGVLGKTVLVI